MTSFATHIARCVMLVSVLSAIPRIVPAVDEGEKVYKDVCTACHDAKTRPLDAKRMTRQQWKEAVDKMEAQGVDVPSGKKLNALLDYLERTHGAESPPPTESK